MKCNIRNLLFILVIILLFSGCRAESRGAEETSNIIEDRIKIGITFDSFVMERWLRERDIFIAKAQELGADVNVQTAYGNLEEQISQIKYFIEKKVDVIVIVAADREGLSDVIDEAKKEGIKVVAYDRMIDNANVDLYISFDNVEVGKLMAENMVNKIGKSGEILLIMGPLSDNNVTLVMEGIKSVLDKTNIVTSNVVHTQGWQGEVAYEEVSKYLARGKVPKGIICGNDTLASNTIRALAENRLAGKVYVTGQDADLDACQRIVEGTQHMTVYKDVETLATQTAQLCVNLAKNQDIIVTDTMNNGKYDVPCENISVTAVTAENMLTVIAGRYHQKSDIYLNVPPPEEDSSK